MISPAHAKSVDVSGDIVISDKILPIDGDLIVDMGSKLTLNNVTLIFFGSPGSVHRIEVLDGASLHITSSSISTIDASRSFTFKVNDNGFLNMINTTVTGCGYDSPDISDRGIWINGHGCFIVDCDISGGDYGIIIEDAAGTTIKNNNISASTAGIYAHDSTGMTIKENVISHCRYGIQLTIGTIASTIKDNHIMNNTFGLVMQNASINTVEGNTFGGNRHSGVSGSYTKTNNIKDNIFTYNGYGIYFDETKIGTISDNIIMYSDIDGMFLDNAKNLVIENNNLSYNDGYGINGTERNSNIALKNNEFYQNRKGDTSIPAASYTLTEISLISIFFALADKLVYVVDFQKFLINSVFAGIVQPVRKPISRRLMDLSDRILSPFGLDRSSHRNLKVTEAMGVLMIHFIDGKDIWSLSCTKSGKKSFLTDAKVNTLKNLYLQIADRVMISRNVIYFAIMAIIGTIIYLIQVYIGTYQWPYLLPLAIQFAAMFPIGLLIQLSIIGNVESIEEVKDANVLKGLCKRLDEKIKEAEKKQEAGALSKKEVMQLNKYRKASNVIDKQLIKISPVKA